MKRLTQKILTLQQKKDIAQGVELMFISLFKSPIYTKDDLVRRVWYFFEHNGVPEHIVKQTILKGLIPKVTFTKSHLISLRETKDSQNKVFVENPNEKTDIRFCGELLTTEKFCNLYEIIEKAFLLSESPTELNQQKTQGIALGEKPKFLQQSMHDVKIFGKGFSSKWDIKSGNNMQNTFSSIIGHLWYKANKPYAITNNIFTLEQIQTLRANFLNYYLKTNSKDLNETQVNAFKIFHLKFNEILNLNILRSKKISLFKKNF